MLNAIINYFEKHPFMIFHLFLGFFYATIYVSQKGDLKMENFLLAVFIWISISMYNIYKKIDVISFNLKYGSKRKNKRLSIPMSIYSNFSYHYFLYDDEDIVVCGAETKTEAIKKHKETGLYIARVYD